MTRQFPRIRVTKYRGEPWPSGLVWIVRVGDTVWSWAYTWNEAMQHADFMCGLSRWFGSGNVSNASVTSRSDGITQPLVSSTRAEPIPRSDDHAQG